MTDCVDGAREIVDIHMDALAELFSPNSPCPPAGGGQAMVRFFGGDAIPMAAWNAHSQSGQCLDPFLWVRVLRRYRTADFPGQTVSVDACTLPRVIQLEMGVGRCATVELEPSWQDYEAEAEVSLDDSWRMELALCRATAMVRKAGYVAGSDAIEPYGPDGGVVAWTGVSYVQF